MRALFLLIIGVILVSAETSGQQTPPRDISPVQPGAAAVRGRVVNNENQAPIARARVNLTALGERGRIEPVYTDAEGRFEFAGLRPGRYSLTVSKTGFVWGLLGEREVERNIQLAIESRTAIENVDVRLLRAAAVSGRLTDDLGDPLLAAGVSVGTLQRIRGQLQFNVLRGTITDDRGEYRVGGLSAGTYLVRVESANAGALLPGAPDEWRRNISWGTTYFPGAPELTGAERLTLRTGEDRSNVDFMLRPLGTRSGKLTVLVNDQSGNPAAGTLQVTGAITGMMTGFRRGRVELPAQLGFGEYLLVARGDAGFAAARIALASEDTTVTLTLGRSPVVAGRIVSDDGSRIEAAQVPLEAISRYQISDARAPAFPLRVSRTPDGTFTVDGVVGPIEFTVDRPDAWQILSVTYDGRDVTDMPIDVPVDGLANVTVVVTRKIARIDGLVVDGTGSPAPGCSALIFPEGRQALQSGRLTRRIRSDLNGRFQLRNLIPGSYYAIAVTRPDPTDWSTPEYLTSLQSSATRITLTGDEPTNVALECNDRP